MVPKISVIIPVYNIYEYLEKCLWSVTNQTLKDIEIIIVNDGSQDNSLEIIEKFASTDSRIRVINKVNDGVVSARNSGLSIATGDYIHYLDGDDYIELNTYELLYSRSIKDNSCMTIMEFWFEDSIEDLYKSKSYTEKEYTNITFLQDMWSINSYFSICFNIHKRSIYYSHEINFEKELVMAEDVYLMSQLAYYSNKISILDQPLYHYVSRMTSATHCKFRTEQVDSLRLFPQLAYTFIKDKPEYKEMKEYLYILKVQGEVAILQGRYFTNMHIRCKEIVNLINEHPIILEVDVIRIFYKLVKMFAISQILGYLLAQYYILKGKIK